MKIAVFGAGSIGCYLGGKLTAAGHDVLLLGRERLQKEIAAHGLKLTHYEKPEKQVAAGAVAFETDPACLAMADVILVTVKSQDSAEAAATIARAARPDTLVVSIQNGIGNADTLRAGLPGWAVAGGMVPFNVVNLGEGHFHCGTEGGIVLEQLAGVAKVVTALNKSDIDTTEVTDIASVLWGKLLLNLNNALNMLSDKPLKEELSDRQFRLVLAEMQREALAATKAAGITPARIGKAQPQLMPTLLSLPNWLFEIVAAGMLKIDPTARSSMWEDLRAGRTPEIDYLQGAVVELGKEVGVPTPVNLRVLKAVNEAFAKGQSPGWSGEDAQRHLLD